MLRIALCMCFAAQLVYGQITGYADVGNFSCNRSAELVSRTTETGTVMSPCYNASDPLAEYPGELTSGLKLISISYNNPYVHGYRLTFRDFQIADSDRLYVGGKTVTAGTATIADRDYTFTSNSTKPDKIEVEEIEDGPVTRTLTLATDNVYDIENLATLIMDFYTVDDTANGDGFLIDYAADLDKCLFTGSDIYCKNGGVCTRTGFNAASCDCDGTGYEGTTCTTDVDECRPTTGTDNCDTNATCTNIIGSFTCKCNDGYTGNGVSCTDINECLPTDPCEETGTCVNEVGKFSCTCNDGYENGAEGKCSDIDECTRGTDTCAADDRATCTNTAGSFTCACKSGYTGDGETCADFDECASTTTHDCNPVRGTCVNEIGSYTCNCKVGYTGDGKTCDDLNECDAAADNNCHGDATCTNNDGSFTCSCNAGFTGNGTICADNDECIETDNCHDSADCSNNAGSYTCDCKTGFTGDGRSACTEINECVPALNPCDDDATCTNEPPGSFTCKCNSGFDGDGNTCTDIDECTTGTHNCDANADCANIEGSFTCACKTGWEGNGVSCSDINECATNTDDCDVRTEADCTNIEGSFTCACKTGYSGDGKTCTDVDECALGTHDCTLSETTCKNTIGSFECICDSPQFRGTPGSCDYYCNHNSMCIKNRTGFIDMPLFHDGTKTYPAFNETFWNFQTSTTGNGIRFTMKSFNTEPKDDFLSMYPGGAVNIPMEIVGISGSVGNLYNEKDAVLSSGYIQRIGSGVPAYINFTGSEVTLTLDSSDIYVIFTSDRLNTSTGFKLAFQYDTNDCPAVSKCQNGGTCEDRAFAYQCTGCTGFEGIDCDIDIKECDAAVFPCDTNADCTNTVGSYVCECKTDYTGDGKTCNPEIVFSNYQVTPTTSNLSVNFDITSTWRSTDYLVDFNITISKVGGGFTQTYTVSLTDLIAGPLQIIGLDTYTEYSITVVVNSKGTEFGTSVITDELGTQNFFTAESTPGTPKNLVFSFASRDRVTLTWAKPDEIGFGKVTHYQICFAPSSATTTQTVADLRSVTKTDTCIFLDDTYTTITLTGLPSYIDLVFKIRAYTSVGAGDFATSDSAFTGTTCLGWTTFTARTTCPVLESLLLSEGFPREIVDDSNEVIRQQWSFSLGPYPGWRPNFKYFYIASRNESVLDYGYGDIDITDHDTEKDQKTGSYTGNFGVLGPSPSDGFTRDASVSAQNTLWFTYISDRLRKRPGFQVEIELDGDNCISTPCLHGGRCDDGKYSYTCDCTSTNWRGDTCQTPHVQPTVTCVPGKTDVAITFSDSAWTSDETVIGGYTVSLSTGGATVNTMNKAFGDSTASFTGLTAFTSYQVSVTGTASIRTPVVYEAGVTTCRTLEDVPTAPRNVALTPGEESLAATWTVPALPNGNLKYTVAWVTTDHATYGEVAVSDSATDITTTSYTITRLRDYRKYDVTVTAITSAGSTSASPISGTTSPGAPPSFATVEVTPLSNKTARVDWTFSPSVYIGPITITIQPVSTLHTTATLATVNVDGSPYSPRTFTYTGVEEDQMYNFTITATTGTALDQTSIITGVNTAAAAPEQPVNFAYDRDTSTFSWTAPALLDRNGPLTGYRLVAVSTVPDFTAQNFTSTELSLQLNNLPPFTTYDFTLQAINSVGLGVPFPLTIVTKEDEPATPASVTQGTTTSTSMTISWPVQTPPVGETTFEITYTEGTVSMTLTTAAAEITIPNLTPYTSYTITVVAKTNAGDAPATAPVVFRTAEGLPTEVQNLAATFTPYSFSVTWDVPATPNGVISGYKVTWSPGGGSVDVADTSLTITGVTLSETKYTIDVLAKTGAGEGPSQIVEVTTPKLLPTAPTSVTVDEISSTTARVGATPPGNAGFIPVTNYIITIRQDQADCQANKDDACTSNDQQKTATLPYLLEKLLPYRLYIVSVVAEGSAGEGPASADKSFKTLVGKPNPPTFISSAIPGGISVTIDPANFTGPASYNVTVTASGGSSVTTTVNETSQLQDIIANVTGLSGSTSYTVSVIAITSAGSTTSTTTSAIVTSPAAPAVSIARTSSSSLTVTITADSTANSYTVTTVRASCTTNCNPQTETITETTTIIAGLDPYVTYDVSVFVTSDAGQGLTTTEQQRTKAGVVTMMDPNFKLPQSNDTDSNFDRAFNIILQNLCVNKGATFDESQGIIEEVWYLVREQGSAETVGDSLTRYYGFANDKQPSPLWVAFKDICSPSSRRKRKVTDGGSGVVIGANPSCPDDGDTICNGRLKPSTTYQFEACGFNEEQEYACTQPSDEYTTDAAPGLTAGEIAAIVICSILFVILVILLIVFLVKRRKQHTGKAKVSEPGRDNRSFEAKPSAQQQKYQVDPAPEAQTEYSGTNA